MDVQLHPPLHRLMTEDERELLFDIDKYKIDLWKICKVALSEAVDQVKFEKANEVGVEDDSANLPS